jgi:hypothetical protein
MRGSVVSRIRKHADSFAPWLSLLSRALSALCPDLLSRRIDSENALQIFLDSREFAVRRERALSVPPCAAPSPASGR